MEADVYQIFEKMGCSLQIKANSRGEGEVVAKVNFLADDKEDALATIFELVQAAIRKTSEGFEDGGNSPAEIEVKLGADGKEIKEKEKFGVRRQDIRNKKNRDEELD